MQELLAYTTQFSYNIIIQDICPAYQRSNVNIHKLCVTTVLLRVDFVSRKMRSQSIVATACNIRMCDQATSRVSDSTVKATLPS